MDPLLSWRKARGESPLSITGPIPKCFETPLLFEPGEGWTYGAGHDWAALLISRITGQKFSDWLKENIGDVVGMDNKIGFDADELEKKTGQKIVMNAVRGDDGKLKEWPSCQFEGESGGGGLIGSVENFAKVLQDLISPTPKLLPPELLDELFKPQLEPNSPSHKALVGSAPIFKAMTGPLTEGLDLSTLNHGLGGVVTTTDVDLGKTTGTLCWGGAFNWVWSVNRKANLAAVYASAMWPPAEEKSAELMGLFAKDVWQKATEKMK